MEYVDSFVIEIELYEEYLLTNIPTTLVSGMVNSWTILKHSL
jgi:hypothetical protein